MPRRASRDWELADRLHSAAIHVLRRARRTDPLTGVSPAQLSALSVLMSGPMTLGRLAAAEQVKPPTMSRLVAEMERSGVARKQTDPNDARAVRIRVTAKGMRALERGREMRIDRIERLVRSRTPQDVAALERAVGVIEDMLGARAAPWSGEKRGGAVSG